MARRRRQRSRGWAGFQPYVPAAARQREALVHTRDARQRGAPYEPVRAGSRRIATTPWGCAWCAHIESFHDYSNRLPRGRTYVRNGSVVHLEIKRGEVLARVMGSELYQLRIEIEPCKPATWKRVRERCAGGIGSLIELLEGRISAEVMAGMTAEKGGLLPDLREVRMGCSCPDWASLCKHLAAVLYGVGVRLDERPELLFLLRGVDPGELVARAALPVAASEAPAGTRKLRGDLESVFGIELDDEPAAIDPPRPPAALARKRRKVKVRRQELLQAGVPAGTIGTWLHQGVLRTSDERGVYLHTRDSRARVAKYGL